MWSKHSLAFRMHKTVSMMGTITAVTYCTGYSTNSDPVSSYSINATELL